MNKIIAIIGPTGVGKTKLSIELAKKFNGEIINVDAMQVYRGLDIGTAKITEQEKEGIIHHLFDIKEVTENYTVFDYQKDARNVIEEIKAKGKTPIFVGGTGLYLKAALFNYEFKEEKDNPEINLSNQELVEKIIKIEGKCDIHLNNTKRLKRHYIKLLTDSKNTNKGNELLYDVIFVGLTTERDVLYDKINKRVDKMMENGLLEEVKSFYDKSIFSKALTSGIGYKELYSYLKGEITLENAIDKIKQNSRHYAKRQYTFFNNQLKVNWFNTNYEDFSKTTEEIVNYINEQ